VKSNFHDQSTHVTTSALINHFAKPFVFGKSKKGLTCENNNKTSIVYKNAQNLHVFNKRFSPDKRKTCIGILISKRS
jgi:hypothetical protein